MNAALAHLQTSAHNIASTNTWGFHRQRVVQLVQQLEANSVFLADLAVFKRSNDPIGN